MAALGVALIAILWVSAPSPGPRQRFEQAVSAISKGHLERAQQEIDHLADDGRFEDHVSTLHGGLLLRSGDPAGALQHLSLVRMENELRLPALLWMGESYYRLGRLAESEACFLPLALERPDLADPHRWLGAIYYDLGALQPAIEQIEQVVRLDPADYRPHHLLGLIHFDMEKYAQAASAFRQALDCNPPDGIQERILVQLCRSLVRNRDFAEAEQVLASARRVDSHPELLILTAECDWVAGRQEQAARGVRRALDIHPDLREALMLRARMAREQERYSEAIVALEQILIDDAHDHEARYEMAMAYRDRGETSAFEREMRKMDESLKLRTRAAELHQAANARPTDPLPRDELALICDSLGRPQLAEMWRRAAAAIRARHSLRERSTSNPATSDAARASR